MIRFILRKAFGSKNERELKRLWPYIQKINDLESSFAKIETSAFPGVTAGFRERLDRGEPLESLLPEAFAAVREASRRVLGMRHFDVQLLGGAVLNGGNIAEMKTGEGKTLCATLPVYLNALPGKGVHVVTVNDYLARRDAEWMGRLYGALGLGTGVVVNNVEPNERQRAYACDITYGQNNEFGFDYLRDNMKLELSDKVQRGHYFAIVDEVDSILVDEARTPLIISGPSEEATDKYKLADDIVRRLKEGDHYEIDLKTKNTILTESGVKFVEELVEIDNLYDPGHIELVHHMNQSLRAHVTMRRDFDYVVRDGQVIIVDEFTGRLMAGRRWSDGLHQAVEAKEGVNIARENQTLATITFQNYFRMYGKLAGMTGTADTEAVEFKKIYKLDAIIIPPNRPMVRKDYADSVLATEKAKFKFVVDEVEELAKRGQPVLVGTASIARSELISGLLVEKGIQHHVLNAKQHEREAEIIAQAGRFGSVTISTNMAGRGTDILLGGNPDFLASSAAGTKDLDDPEYKAQLEIFKVQCQEERLRVVEAGGLHILGTERHESRRIDNQLRGRAGRQGDPGSTRFYISLEDDLMKRFGGERMQKIMAFAGLKEDEMIEGNMVARAIERAQKKVEGHNFDIRKHLLEYDDVMNKQRSVIYTLREKILRSEGLEEEVREMLPDVVEDIILTRADENSPNDQWKLDEMLAMLNGILGFQFSKEDVFTPERMDGRKLAQDLFEMFREKTLERYEERKQWFGPDRMAKLERVIYLQAIDHFWKEHLMHMDHLKDGIYLRGYAQKNPLYEYQTEAYSLFEAMMMTVKTAVVQNVMVPELPSDQQIREMEERERLALREIEARAKTIHDNSEAAAAPQIELAPTEPPAPANREQRRAQGATASNKKGPRS